MNDSPVFAELNNDFVFKKRAFHTIEMKGSLYLTIFTLRPTLILHFSNKLALRLFYKQAGIFHSLFDAA